MNFIKYTVILLLSLVLILFCVVNRAPATIDLFPIPYSFEIPLFMLVLASMMMGVIVTGLVMNIKSMKTYCALKQSKKRVAALENENKAILSEREPSFVSLPKP